MDQAIENFFAALPRQGPGDDLFVEDILEWLPGLPKQPTIADFGCGTGRSALHLARRFGVPVLVIDLSHTFIETLQKEAAKSGESELVDAKCADMATPPVPTDSLDLIWSEGAAYTIGFENALKTWRPLLKEGGVLVVTELVWLKSDAPEHVKAFWSEGYPAMDHFEEVQARAKAIGYDILHAAPMPDHAWRAYYDDILKALEHPAASDLPTDFRDAMKTEARLYFESEGAYGYGLLILRKS